MLFCSKNEKKRRKIKLNVYYDLKVNANIKRGMHLKTFKEKYIWLMFIQANNFECSFKWDFENKEKF